MISPDQLAGWAAAIFTVWFAIDLFVAWVPLTKRGRKKAKNRRRRAQARWLEDMKGVRSSEEHRD